MEFFQVVFLGFSTGLNTVSVQYTEQYILYTVYCTAEGCTPWLHKLPDDSPQGICPSCVFGSRKVAMLYWSRLVIKTAWN